MGISELEIVSRLALAGVLGGLIGLERESNHRPAGFRTHILVCIGSALVMLLSIYAFADPRGGGRTNYDPGRLAAQVVSGIGFLGAGTIMREGASVRGLTTAASLWVVAGIGLAVGSGFYLGASLATALSVTTLILLSRVEILFLSSKQTVLAVKILDQPGQLGAIATVLGRYGVDIKGVEMNPEEGERTSIELAVHVPARIDRTKLLEEVLALPGVFSAAYDR